MTNSLRIKLAQRCCGLWLAVRQVCFQVLLISSFAYLEACVEICSVFSREIMVWNFDGAAFGRLIPGGKLAVNFPINLVNRVSGTDSPPNGCKTSRLTYSASRRWPGLCHPLGSHGSRHCNRIFV